MQLGLLNEQFNGLSGVVILGTAWSVAIVSLWLAARTWCLWKESKIPLLPNCLLTRKPLVLISFRTAAWKFWTIDRKALRFLRNHGYETHLLHIGEVDSEVESLENLHQIHILASDSLLSRPIFKQSLDNLSFLDFSDTKALLKEAVCRAEEDFV